MSRLETEHPLLSMRILGLTQQKRRHKSIAESTIFADRPRPTISELRSPSQGKCPAREALEAATPRIETHVSSPTRTHVERRELECSHLLFASRDRLQGSLRHSL